MFTKMLRLSALLLALTVQLCAQGVREEVLTPPNIGAAHIKKKITCIRPMRNGRFELKAEIKDGKLIAHNYGAGGSGWTLLFGLVNESIRQFEAQVKNNPQFANKPIRVIGAGCMGLLSAIMLKEKGYEVKITARELKEITSDKAGGRFGFSSMCTSAEEQKFVNDIGFESLRVYSVIAQHQHPYLRKGAEFMPAYIGKKMDSGYDSFVEVGMMEKPELVTVSFGNGKTHELLKYHSIFIDIPELMRQFHRLIAVAGIEITQAEVKSFDEVTEPIIFNCAGLGAGALAHDDQMIPVQGHMFVLKNQPDMSKLKYMLSTKVETQDENGNRIEEPIYYMPKWSGVLGGTFIKGVETLTTNKEQFKRMLERSMNFFGHPVVVSKNNESTDESAQTVEDENLVAEQSTP